MAVLYLVISVVLIILLTARLKIHPFLALLAVALLYGFATGMPYEKIIESINTGFGDTIGKIGLIIVFGIIIGAFLENSGGAYRLAESLLRLVGQKRVATAMGIIGYFVSIPVFADSGFMLLSSLNKSLAKRAGISLTVSSIALAMGLMSTHTMVPPTPGPIAAAGILNADLGLVMLVGIPVSAFGMVVCIWFAKTFASKKFIDPTPDISDEQIHEKLVNSPGLFKSSMPVVVPILLIVLKSLIGSWVEEPNDFYRFLLFIGEPAIALIIGVLLALLLPKKLEKSMLSTDGWVGKALMDAATIILVTGAGGIFGRILQNSGIADMLGETLAGINIGIWLPFLLAAAIKTAQGSSTVALITTASILVPMMETLGFTTELHKAMLVIAIGAGSAVFSHANDSYFWVVTQMSGMDVKMGYRLHSVGSAVLGFSSAFLLFIAYLIFT